MSSYSKTILVGNLTRAPETKVLASGTTVANLGIAVNENRKVDGEWQSEPHFFDCTAFGKTAEILADYDKGESVLIEGKLRQERWESDGGKRSKVVIMIDRVIRVSKKQSNGSQDDPARVAAGGPDMDDDMPW